MNKQKLINEIIYFFNKEYGFNISCIVHRNIITFGFYNIKREIIQRIFVYQNLHKIEFNFKKCNYNSMKDIKSFLRKEIKNIGLLNKTEAMIKDIIE